MTQSYKGGDAVKGVTPPRASDLSQIPSPLAAFQKAVAGLVPGVYKRWQYVPKAGTGKATK